MHFSVDFTDKTIYNIQKTNIYGVYNELFGHKSANQIRK